VLDERSNGSDLEVLGDDADRLAGSAAMNVSPSVRADRKQSVIEKEVTVGAGENNGTTTEPTVVAPRRREVRSGGGEGETSRGGAPAGPGEHPVPGGMSDGLGMIDLPASPTPSEADAVDRRSAVADSRTVGADEMDRAAQEMRRVMERVPRETGMPKDQGLQAGEDAGMDDDEAAIAVREAALRAAAQVQAAEDEEERVDYGAPTLSTDHEVSRETLDSGQPPLLAPDGAPGQTSPAMVDTEAAARAARVTFQIKTSPGEFQHVLTVANQKGGVGKSTTAVNLGAYLALAGARILVIDLDPQGNATTGLGLDHRHLEQSVYDVLTGEVEAQDAVRQTMVPNLDVLPSTIDLAGAEVELVSAISRESRLQRALMAVRPEYDAILIDCPPSLGLLTVNALAAADELLIPIQCEYYALEGLGQLLRNVDLVRANLNPELAIGGIVLTMYDGRTRLAEQVVQEVRKHFSSLVYQTVVPRSVRLSEAPGYGIPIALYDPLSRGGIAYRDLALEFAARTGLLASTTEGVG
jgi:chromosome partitioning protein